MSFILPQEISDEIKKRIESPIFGPVLITWIIWNFDALFRFLYSIGNEWESADSILKDLHLGLIYTKPLIVGFSFAILREPFERSLQYIILFLKAFVDYLGQKSEWPNLKKRIVALEKERDKIQINLSNLEKNFGIFSSVFTHEKLSVFSKNISKAEKWDIAFVSEDVKSGDFLSYNSNSKEYEPLTKSQKVNGIVVFKFSSNVAIIGFEGKYPLDLFKFDSNERKKGGYFYDVERKFLSYALQDDVQRPVNATLDKDSLSIVLNSKEDGFRYLKSKMNLPFNIQ